ncbi:rCG24704 [Rattus norvegicus]|uniref:RCG24704 n=1 Tax=Rattus norvegicus TaxID=10116 RepID=A6JBV8_RAT|nr:rCG24704 [Rattus norvegicus]
MPRGAEADCRAVGPAWATKENEQGGEDLRQRQWMPLKNSCT